MISGFFLWLIGGVSCLVLSVSSGQKFPPPLGAREEAELFTRLRETGDESVRARLIEHNLRLVAHIVRKYYTSHTAQDDLISIGTIGLIKAVDSYSDRGGARFATYAAKCIQNAIHTPRLSPVSRRRFFISHFLIVYHIAFEKAIVYNKISDSKMRGASSGKQTYCFYRRG